MQAGKLKHSVTVQRDTGTVNSSGQVVENWTTYITRRAEIVPLTGRELFAAQQVDGEVTHKVIMRYDSGVTSKMRLLFGSRVLNIESIININEANRDMELICKEITS